MLRVGGKERSVLMVIRQFPLVLPMFANEVVQVVETGLFDYVLGNELINYEMRIGLLDCVMRTGLFM